MVNSLKEYLDLVKAKNWVLTIKEKVYREDIPALIEKLSWEGTVSYTHLTLPTKRIV